MRMLLILFHQPPTALASSYFPCSPMEAWRGKEMFELFTCGCCYSRFNHDSGCRNILIIPIFIRGSKHPTKEGREEAMSE
ncbi:hypothetical protein BKA58DRAFT_374768 [Alternaria rosae]|uniref:uncharacterized protein n=1 Tax=Alternaria rosae TaxID=1187941 RepID=UPI001E8CCDFA|nr:uncharacterized protein BKA58DRAFT_374768 [Alternaria rosae]KAH6883254.1 hypothetical protein BKA58DRAFT_374768 [Alternaria rosae]